MSVTRQYRDAWEGFWREAPEAPHAVFWDAEPALTAGRHLALFEPHLTDPGLPMVDLGCGNGTQTRYLAYRFARVVGADLSAAALDRARRADPAGRAAYRQLDITDKGEVQSLHAELGDANVYLRGVLHQTAPDDRQQVADALAALLGRRGRAFLVEPAEAAVPVLAGLAEDPGGPPPKLEPVLRHGMAPGTLVDDAVPDHVRAAGLEVLRQGELPLVTTEYRPDGTRIELPSIWLVVGPAG
ncbi:class I SAM-dependent methyltransferase [Streptomyces griseoviridis]|uniref:Methyltransferase n=3 Tax=Streptomyces TaxID=1883 RepID=A0A918GLX1_STRGD|nr:MULTISPECIES: class I SAM-dependent methyltransferase [Streptomyces]MDP9685153.1 SAM-dependent methyltransferase [Streptomyces griseoviridis]GGS42222.1 methyltransferase [Streptomyces niveoruber]GGS95082.1 methyltransferase [Streptomyces griseoviridis]GGU32459.1 methyltransferase [Streptomyces daghestanicus]GHI32053.1 methyltransferase [Streptomyces daghestanicus]